MAPKDEPTTVVDLALDTDDSADRDLASNVSRRFFRPRTIVSFLLAFAILLFFATRANIDFVAVVARIRTAAPLPLVLAFAIYYLSFPVRALRWRLLLHNAGVHQATQQRLPGVGALAEMILVSWFVNCIVPAKLGDAYRGYLLKRAAAVSFSTTIGTIVAERMVDVVVLFGLLVAAGLVAFHGRLPPELLYLLLAGGGLVLVVMLGLVGMRGLRPIVARLLPGRLHVLYEKLEHGILRSVRPRSLPLLLAYTGGVWLFEGLRLYGVASALGVTLPVSVTLFIALASSLLTTIPFTPAGLGIVESAVVTVLLWFGADPATAFSVSLLDRVISYWSVIAVGLIAFLLRANRERLAALGGSMGASR